MRVVVLGGGLVGGAIARDLALDGEYQVTVCDISSERLEKLEACEGIDVSKVDLSNADQLSGAVSEADVVVGAVPGHMGFETVRRVIEQGKDIVDISFFPEDAMELDSLAGEGGVRCLVDFGVAPGCSNLICGRSLESFKEIDQLLCMVGGLPEERILPWEYQAPFSPSDVLEEYSRPARILKDGEIVTLPPLTQRELVDFPGVGTLEAFLTDGLRTLLRFREIPDMIEKTLRYPGYLDKIDLLMESGFMDTEPLIIGGKPVVPLELTSELLFRAWKQEPCDRDLTVMLVSVMGTLKDGRRVCRTWNMLDRYDEITGTSSMARTTGYACTAGVRMLSRGLWKETGVHPPEDVGRDGTCFDFIMDELRKRNVCFEPSECEI